MQTMIMHSALAYKKYKGTASNIFLNTCRATKTVIHSMLILLGIFYLTSLFIYRPQTIETENTGFANWPSNLQIWADHVSDNWQSYRSSKLESPWSLLDRNIHSSLLMTTPNLLAAANTQQKNLANDLTKRYKIAPDAAQMVVHAAYQAGHDLQLDPILILAVMATESSFNPFAQSEAGAKGLMQVMATVHADKFDRFGGSTAALHPVANIYVGARILKNYLRQTGSVNTALKYYVGAANIGTDGGYAKKVLGEQQRLKNAAQKVWVQKNKTAEINAAANTRHSI